MFFEKLGWRKIIPIGNCMKSTYVFHKHQPNVDELPYMDHHGSYRIQDLWLIFVGDLSRSATRSCRTKRDGLPRGERQFMFCLGVGWRFLTHEHLVGLVWTCFCFFVGGVFLKIQEPPTKKKHCSSFWCIFLKLINLDPGWFPTSN